MKAHLMYADRDFELHAARPVNEEDLTRDLGLDALISAMSGDDELVGEVARSALVCGVGTVDEVTYRQAALADCLAHPDTVRGLYRVATESVDAERKIYLGILASRTPGSVLSRSIKVLETFVAQLRQLRSIAERDGDAFGSEAFRTLFAMLHTELGPEYFDTVEAHLRDLTFHEGVVMTAGLGSGNKGTDYVLRRPDELRQSWFRRLAGKPPSGYTLTVDDRDVAGAQALGELRDHGLALVATALGRSTAHVLGFFDQLRVELAFYIGCVNLAVRLEAKGAPMCFVEVTAGAGPHHRSARGLYDVGLALQIEGPVVGNDLDADGKRLVMITGANQGGKSTFLRSAGLAQMMLQAGMYVGARSMRASLCSGIFTHYRREEDVSMSSGKLDEELARMSTLVDSLRPGGLVLFNESFAATNERDGSEIASQVVEALVGSGTDVIFVTHLYELARRFYDQDRDDCLFLRAERETGGQRTFKLRPARPLETSYGEDLYRLVFGVST